MLDPTIFSKTTLHSLRATSLLVFPPAFIVLITQGLITTDINPAIGILPIFFSSAYSALALANEKRCACQAYGLMGTPLHFVLDLGLGLALLMCLILDYIFLSQSTRGDPSMAILGTYGTNFLLCNFLIHTYFVFKHLSATFLPSASYVSSCSACKNESSFSIERVKSALGVGLGLGLGLKQECASLLDDDDVYDGYDYEYDYYDGGDSDMPNGCTEPERGWEEKTLELEVRRRRSKGSFCGEEESAMENGGMA